MTPSEEIGFTRGKGEQKHGRIFEDFNSWDRSQDVELAPDGHFSILETPYFELIFLTHGQDTLFFFYFLDVIDLLLVHAESSINVL